MALVSRNWGDWWPERSIWRDRFSRDWDDWPMDWPRPREIVDRFRHNSDRWWRDWPTDWPRMDTIVPRFSSHLDRFDRNWRADPFWRDLYPRWAEPIFKEGLDVKTNIVNDRNRFAVEIDTYQFRPEELQVKTMDDTLLIEGRHEDVKDAENYTKMYFVRKYQLPSDVNPMDVTSAIDSRGRLLVEAQKRYIPIDGRERAIPIESASRRPGSRSSSYSPRDRFDSGRGSAAEQNWRNDSRNTSSFLEPNYYYSKPVTVTHSAANDNNNDYRTAFTTQSTDANGMRHESRRESFREVRRTGSAQSIPPPAPPMDSSWNRSESRQSGGYARRSGEYSREGEHILRPAEEMNGGRSTSRAESRERSVRISRNY